uniref:Uncharacterized protein n=1 Tax=Arundo donax TaxID=35708 RepID=A0A0A9GFB6_ARUDO
MEKLICSFVCSSIICIYPTISHLKYNARLLATCATVYSNAHQFNMLNDLLTCHYLVPLLPLYQEAVH